MTDERYKQLMESVGLPNSQSLLLALKQAVIEATLDERNACQLPIHDTMYGDENFIQNRFGYCFYALNAGNPIVYNLFVHPVYRGRGAARKLVLMVIQEIRTGGYTGKITVDAKPFDASIDLQRLIRFYEGLGLTLLVDYN